MPAISPTLNPASPLMAMLNTNAPKDGNWQQAAIDACRESVARIDSMFGVMSNGTDRDLQVCLGAVRNSLTWLLEQPVSDRQVQITMLRAVKIFESAPVFEFMPVNELGETA